MLAATALCVSAPAKPDTRCRGPTKAPRRAAAAREGTKWGFPRVALSRAAFNLVGWLRVHCPTLDGVTGPRRLGQLQSVRCRCDITHTIAAMDKAQEAAAAAAGMAQMDYPASELGSIGRDLLPPPAYQRPGSERLKVSVVLASALVAISIVVGVVVVLVVHLRAQQTHCACAPLPQAAALKGRAGDLSSAASGSVISKLPMPLKLQLDPLAGQLLKKNQRAQVSCVVEKKKASEVIAHEPRTLMTPFGNMTTEPRMVHLTGERMIFSCLTGTRDEPRGAGAASRGPAGAAAPGQGNGPSRMKRGIAEEKDCACNCSC
nr:uncharacterized protein LOC126544027 [Dermacentor andersoni]